MEIFQIHGSFDIIVGFGSFVGNTDINFATDVLYKGANFPNF